MKLFYTLTILAGLVICPAAQAENATRDDFKRYAAATLGRWSGDVTSVISEQNLGAKGDTYQGRWESEMIQDNQAIVFRFTGPESTSQSVCYFDAASEKIRVNEVSSKGFTNQHEIYPEGDQWIRHTRFTSPDGTVSKLRSVITHSKDGDTITVLINGKVGDRVVDNQKNVWHREKNSSADELTIHSYFQGLWQIDTDENGKKSTEFGRCIGSTGDCNIWFGKHTTSIHGYDPKTGPWRGVLYSDDGSRMERVIKTAEDTKIVAGTKLTFSDKIYHPDGRITHSTVQFTCLGPNRFHEATTQKDKDGKVLTSFEMVAKRLKPAGK